MRTARGERRRRIGQLGLSLVDAVIAVSIVVIAIGVAYPGLKIANDTMKTSGRKDRIERAGDMMLKRIVGSRRGGRIVAMSEAPAPPEMTLGRVGQNVNLEEFEAKEEVPWENSTFTIRFRQIEVIKESEAGTDINGDGDRSDEFAAGLLEIDDGETARPITQSAQVLLGLPGYAKDVDGDGKSDPLFSRHGRTVTIDIHLVSRAQDGYLLKTSVRGTVRLRNAQE